MIEHCGLTVTQPPTGDAEPRILFAGDDMEGIALEVIGIEIDDQTLMVIHSMPLRARYRQHYEEAKKWRR